MQIADAWRTPVQYVKRRKWRVIIGLALFLWTEACLMTASEGVEKSMWIAKGTIPNVVLTFGFALL
jgi:hypothetical protein